MTRLLSGTANEKKFYHTGGIRAKSISQIILGLKVILILSKPPVCDEVL